MNDKMLDTRQYTTFEKIRQVDEEGNEYWMARTLGRVLDYSEYRHFLPVIEKAKEACKASGHRDNDHFEDVLDMVEIGSGAQRKIPDVRQTIKDLGGTMPEDLPTPEKSIRQIETSQKKIDEKK